MKEETMTNALLVVLVNYAKSTDSKIDSMDSRLDSMDGRLMRVESQMVTKDYLDDKLANLRGELIQIIDSKIELACT